MQPMPEPKLTMDEEEVVEGEDTQTGASGNWTAKASKYNRRQNDAYTLFPLGGAYIQPWQRCVWLFAHIL